ncbi:MAG: IPTL-CTERM sorting domain-containing protein [Thiothrix sp.]
MKITKLSVCVSMVGLLATLPAAYANEIITNCTQVTATGEGDLDSTPNNMVGETVAEDDESCAKVMIPFDYGDAPDPAYQTLDASGGARHQLGTDVFLGQCVDGDSGLLQGGATADDADAGSPVYGTCATASDEDGVTFGELRVGETGATVEVIASKDCKLNAWVDWNVDGNWGGTAEQVFLNQQLTAGINSLTLNVPASAVLGDTYARFRCSTVGNDGIGGEAADGEVEDYKVSILEAIPVTPVSVGDTIWIDANENGVQDLDESPLEGATVTLLDKDGNPVKDLDGNDVTAATTGTDGKYLFSNLPEGDYIVRVAPPSGYQVTSGGADVDDNPANDDNNCAVVGNNVETAPFNLAAGMEPVNDGDTDANTNLSVDCGFFQPPAPTHSIGNLVWVDDGNGSGSVADNGLFEDGETRISGIQMELRDKDGNPLSSTLTAGGYYLFSGLAAGEYQVCVAASNFTAGGQLEGYGASTVANEIDANLNVDNNDNGDDIVANGLCSNVVILDDQEPTGETPTASGTAGDDGQGTEDARSNLTVDFALTPPVAATPVSVGDTIWIDANENGLQDEGESPLAGATVTLLDAGGNPVKDLGGNDVTAATTGTDGKYLFDNLPEGDYIVRVTPPSGYQATSGGADADDNPANNDSNCAVVGSNIQTLPFTLTAGMEPDVGADGDGTNSNLTVDCGFYQPPEPTHSIGNRVWVDANNNGLADVGENPAVAGITLELKGSDGSDGSAIASTQTNAEGRYLFSGLGAGSYQVCVAASNFATGALLEGYTASTGGNVVDANTDIDGDDNGTDDTSVGLCSNMVVLGDQEPLDEATATGNDGDDGVGTEDNRSNLTVDFGIVPPAPATPVSVGDYIWVDANENGLQDEGDGLLAGATVTLLDKDGNPVKDLDGNTVTAATTGTDGKYLFSNLPEGDYIVRVVPPAGYQVTTGGADVDDNPANDDNNCAVVGSNIQTLPFTLTASMEPDVAADGDGTNSNLTVDCGFYQPPAPTHSIGNMVWVDNGAGNAANANNGIRDAGEAAVKDGVVMELLDKDGIVIREVQTSDGYYLFSGLEAGDYRVCVAHGNFDLGLLAGYTASSGGDEADVNSNGDNNDNGDNDTQNGLCSDVITLNDQEPTGETPTASGIAGDDGQGTEDARSNLTVDFGVIPPVIPVSVGDTIWIDANKDGVKDASETALSGATVTLLDKDGNPAKDLDGNNVTAVTTGTDGKYLFSNLPEGDYIVRVTPPSGYQVTTGGADVDDNPANNDNNCAVVGNNVQTAPFTLMGGMEPDVAADGDGKDSNLTVDCGFFQPPAPTHSIGNMVWVDNGNGQFDDGEVRPSGVKVELHDKDGNLLSSTLTAGGYYLFSGLDAGSYRVCVAASNFDAGGVLAGHTPSTVSDETDANSDGDGNDNGDNTIADGLCSNLVVLDDKEPKGEFPTAIGTAGDDGQGTDDALSNLTVDFAVLAPAPLAVGNRIWLDSNGNGIQDADEPGLTGATVTLKDSAGNTVVDIDGNNVAPQTTGADGLYRFDKLLEGEYVVSITAPAGYTPTTGGLDVDSDASDKDSNCRINSVSGAFDTLPFNLKAGTEPDTSADGDDTNGNMTVDCGMVRPLKLGSRIWLDLDGDGSQDEGEPGIAGATVTLLTADGNPVTDIFGNPVQPMVTDADGNYAFGNLREGSYVLKVTPPAGYMPTVLAQDPNDDDSTDSNGFLDAEGNLITQPISLTPGAEPDEGGYANLTVGFGLVPRVTDEIPPMQVPTLSQWGMAILSMLLAAVGFSRRRRDDQG